MANASRPEPCEGAGPLASLPRCVRLGLPIPWVVPIRKGVARFKSLMQPRLKRCCTERRCHICGNQVASTEPLVFIETDVAKQQPPMHEACARASLKVCPHLRNAGAYMLTYSEGVTGTFFGASKSAVDSRVEPREETRGPQVGDLVTVAQRGGRRITGVYENEFRGQAMVLLDSGERRLFSFDYIEAARA